MMTEQLDGWPARRSHVCECIPQQAHVILDFEATGAAAFQGNRRQPLQEKDNFFVDLLSGASSSSPLLLQHYVIITVQLIRASIVACPEEALV